MDTMYRIAEYLKQGMTNKEIQRATRLTKRGVNYYMERILRKAGLYGNGDERRLMVWLLTRKKSKRALRLVLVLGVLGLGVGLGALPASAQHSVALTWVASTSATGCVSPCVFGYNVYRGASAGGEGTTPLNTSLLTVVSFTDTTVALGQTYYYEVEAVETLGGVTVLSIPSNEVSCTFPAQPAPPTGLLGKAK